MRTQKARLISLMFVADGVWARRYHPPGTIFIDGFEDGDTSGWD